MTLGFPDRIRNGGGIVHRPGFRRTPAATGSSAVRSRLRALLFPLLFFEAYLALTLALFAFGPVEPVFDDRTAVWAYALLGQVAIAVGFGVGSIGPPRTATGRAPLLPILKLAIVVSLALLAVSLQYRNYGDMSLVEALADPGAGYQAKQESLRWRESTPIISALRALAGPLIGLSLAGGILYWRRLRPLWRLLWLAGVACWASESVLTGSSKGLFDLVLTFPWLIWLAMRHSGRSPRGWGSRLRRSVPLVLAVALLALGIEAFSYFTHSRARDPKGLYPVERIGWSEPLYGVELPEGLEHRIYMVSRYLTYGYNGLAGSLELPFEWCYGVGHSGLLSRLAARLSSDPEALLTKSYPARLERETGYSSTAVWHTIYPWLASDLTFPGALLFMALMAFLLARVWSDCLASRDLFAGALLVQLILMFFYVPANNIRLYFSEELFSFWGLLVLWLLTRGRRVDSETSG